MLNCKCSLAGLITPFVIITLLYGTGFAKENKDMGGWETDSPYNQHYNPDEMDSFKGTVVGLETIVPMPGMSPGVAVLVRESKEDITTVHLCPLWFAGPEDVGIKKGDRVKVKGVWAEIDGNDVFIASKIKVGDFFEFKVRLTNDGTPFWTMTPEELEKERENQ